MTIAVHTCGGLRAAYGSSVVAPFVDAVPAVYAVAERSAGFVWRFDRMSDPRAQADYDAYCASEDGPSAVTLSVWESVAALRHYVFKTLHGKFYDRKEEWFLPATRPMMVLWTVEGDAHPTLKEARARIEHLRQHGPTEHAFDWQTAPRFTRGPSAA